jgi:hypothetical protein
MTFVYLANSKYGGWVSFSAHLALIAKRSILKISDSGRGVGDYGYGVRYKNITLGHAHVLENKFITAIDKKHRHSLKYFKNSIVVIHDPTELDDDVVNFLRASKKVITIRKTVADLLSNLGIQNEFIEHPFYRYEKGDVEKIGKAVSASRIDFDKGTHTIVEANNIGAKIDIYGSKNPFYYYHKLKSIGFDKYYLGEYKKTFSDSKKIYGGYEMLVDLSVIKNDGGGTQYTFLEADYWGQTIIVHKKWAESPSSIWRQGENCYAVASPEELLTAINNKPLSSGIMTNSNDHWQQLVEYYEAH